MNAYLKLRWRGLLKLALWIAANMWVVPRLPLWGAAIFYAALAGYLGYQFGVQAERKRRIEDAMRYGDDLVRLRDMMDESVAGLREGWGGIDRALAILRARVDGRKSDEELN